MAAASQNYLRDRGTKLVLLLVITVITQIFYAAYVRDLTGNKICAACTKPWCAMKPISGRRCGPIFARAPTRSIFRKRCA